MRPNSIVTFEKLYLGAMVIGVINGALNWNNAAAVLESDPNLAAMGSGFLIISLIIGIGISLLLWYFVARKASTVAKWIVTIFFVLGLISFPFSIASLPTLNLAITLVTYAMQGYAVYLLFRPDANAWFAGEIQEIGDTFD